jgi:hypothetical protein
MAEGEKTPKIEVAPRKPMTYEEFRFKKELLGKSESPATLQPFNNFYLSFIRPESQDTVIFGNEPWTLRLKAEHPDVYEKVAHAVEVVQQKGENIAVDEAVNKALYEAYLICRNYVKDDWDLFA